MDSEIGSENTRGPIDGTNRPQAARGSLWLMIGPGLLLAATGVGSGDLATGSLVGSLLGTAVLWAVLLGALLKFIVTEGLTRWQLATGDTLLEGAVHRVGPIVIWLFLPYLFLWSFFVASALMSACGITLYAVLPVFGDPLDGKIAFGILSGVAGVLIVIKGGYRLFERVMRACIGLMFVTVIATAALLWPGTAEVLRGLLVPSIPSTSPDAVTWTVALIGGVGGTLTVLCYGYWLREEGRTSPEDLRVCRIDLGTSYLMTAVFGMAMLIVGSSVRIEGEGTQLLVTLSERLSGQLGPAGKWLFLIGTFGAVFSSLLGVWQCVPHLFADCVGLLSSRGGKHQSRRIDVDTRAASYRIYLLLIGFVPMIGLFWSFREVQKVYAVTGALFFPLLALALLIFNGRTSWVGRRYRNRPLTVISLLGVLAFFSWIAIA